MSNVTERREADTSLRDRGYLPHWERQGATYLVTFRLADSLPQSVLASYKAERQALLAKAQAGGKTLSDAEQAQSNGLFSFRIQRYLDSGKGACDLANPAIGEIVAQALRHFRGSRYHLYAWCIMPNHVHAVLEPIAPHALASILHSWKSFTANQAHQILRRQGAFWQREYYDHQIEDERTLWRLIEYVAQNPNKAGLEDWRWVEVSLPFPSS